MKIKSILIGAFVVMIGQITILAQDKSKDKETKMEAFVSKTGVITRMEDKNLTDLKVLSDLVKTRVRKVSSGPVEGFYYQLEKSAKYGSGASSSVASVAYTDLLEIIKALSALKMAESKDAALQADYIENRFTTEDGFQIGYFVARGKSTWFMRLEEYGSGNSVFTNDVAAIEAAFLEGKNLIETLRNR